MSGLWGFRDPVPDRAAILQTLGFSERQARFLVTVMVHSGVFIQRQSCRFAGLAHRQKTHDFINRLIGRGFAREIRPGALHRGRLYHIQHKRLYTAIGQVDNRNRRRAPLSRMIERVMLLDAVLDDPEFIWLGAESDKARILPPAPRRSRIERRELPRLTFGTGARQTLRLFPDKLPIGVDPIRDRYVFTYLVTRRVPVDFRAFLVRHITMLKLLYQWRVRVLVPKRFEKAIPVFRHFCARGARHRAAPSEADELGRLFQHERGHRQSRRSCPMTASWRRARSSARRGSTSCIDSGCATATASSGTPTRRRSPTSSSADWRLSSSSFYHANTCTSATWLASPERRRCRLPGHPHSQIARGGS